LIGEWSDVQVAEGQSVPGGLQVVITIYSKSVPSSVSSTTRHHHDDDDDDKPAQVVVYHTYTDAGGTHTDLIEAPCAATPVPDCLTTKRLANGNLQITVYAAHNGGFKGGLK
jgi:hypothetical protein